MVARAGPPATANREPRQARKGAAVAAMPGAGIRLVRAAPINRRQSGLLGTVPAASDGKLLSLIRTWGNE